MKHKVLALGSNAGDKLKQFIQAKTLLKDGGVRILKESSLYETEPVDCEEDEWFLNQVLTVSTSLSSYECYRLAKQIEKDMGRVYSKKNAPRPIDIDLIMWDDSVLSSDELTIPHPRIHGRKFVLLPLLEIIPDPNILVWLVENIHDQEIRKYEESSQKNT